MKNRICLILVSSLLTASLLVGCGGKTDKEEGAKEGDKVKIRFSTWDNADTLTQQQGWVDEFNAAHDNIHVSLEGYGDDYDTKISAQMGSHDAPDCMYMWNYPAYYEGLEDLTPYLDKEGNGLKEDYYEAMWPYNKIEEKIYGMPVDFTTHCLFYNKDIFDKAGVGYPTSDWTWDDLKKAAKMIEEKSENVKGFSFQMKPDPYDFEMYLWSDNASYSGDTGELEGNLNSSKAVETFKMFQEMEKDGYAVATEKNGTDEFLGGKTAMYVYGSWSIQQLNDEGLNWGVVEIPAFAGAGRDSASVVSTSGIAMSKDSKHKEEAWEFIKYWTGAEMEKKRISYALPVMKSVAESEKIKEKPENAPFYKMLEQSDGCTPTSFKSSFIEKSDWSKVNEDIELAFERILNPSTLEDPKQVLDETAGK